MGSLDKLVALLGTPLAGIYAIGILAQVANVWLVETAYEFKFVTAWHIVSIMDKAVVIGLGLKYLLYSLPIALLALLLLPRLLRRLPESASRYAILRHLRQGVLSNSEDENQKSWLEQWIWLVCVAFVVSILIVVVSLPVRAYLSSGDDPVLKYLPHASIIVAATPPSMGSNGQALVGLSELSYNETQNEQAVEPTTVEGVLLSHDEAYWYVFSEQGPSKGTIVAIPLTQTSEVRMMPEG